MKKIVLFMTLISSVLFFAYCSHSKKATSSTGDTTPAVAKVTYTNNIVPAIMGNCVPCHVPSKGGNKKAYDNYANVKADINEIVRRIELNPTDRGFMPFKHAKLSDSLINVFKAFRDGGTLEN